MARVFLNPVTDDPADQMCTNRALAGLCETLATDTFLVRGSGLGNTAARMTSSSTHQRIWRLPKKLRRWLSFKGTNSGSGVPERGAQAPYEDAERQRKEAVSPPPGPATAASPNGSDFKLGGLFLLSQRLDVLTERLELLQERLNEAIATALSAKDSAASCPRPAKDPTFAPEPNPRAAGGDSRDPSPGGRLDPAGTLRPPRVPSGLDGLPRPSVMPEFTPTQSVVVGPVVSGTLPDLCLATLLGLFELERRSGVLAVHGERSLQLELRDGVVVNCQLDGVPTPAVQGVREAFRWRTGRFAFRRTQIAAETEPPLSVSALMLEAMRQNDEAARAS